MLKWIAVVLLSIVYPIWTYFSVSASSKFVVISLVFMITITLTQLVTYIAERRVWSTSLKKILNYDEVKRSLRTLKPKPPILPILISCLMFLLFEFGWNWGSLEEHRLIYMSNCLVIAKCFITFTTFVATNFNSWMRGALQILSIIITIGSLVFLFICTLVHSDYDTSIQDIYKNSLMYRICLRGIIVGLLSLTLQCFIPYTNNDRQFSVDIDTTLTKINQELATLQQPQTYNFTTIDTSQN